jgi:hypothetical protein
MVLQRMRHCVDNHKKNRTQNFVFFCKIMLKIILQKQNESCTVFCALTAKGGKDFSLLIFVFTLISKTIRNLRYYEDKYSYANVMLKFLICRAYGKKRSIGHIAHLSNNGAYENTFRISIYISFPFTPPGPQKP